MNSLLLTFVLLHCGPTSEEPVTLKLSSLSEECRVERRWFGLVPRQPWAAWLVCTSEEFLLQTPSNLTGRVKIDDKEDAIEFLEFFSSLENYQLFSQPRALSLPGDIRDKDDWRNELVGELRKLKLKTDIEISVFDGTSAETGGFVVRRTLVGEDRIVRRVREYLREDGYYDIAYESVLYQDISDLGFLVSP